MLVPVVPVMLVQPGVSLGLNLHSKVLNDVRGAFGTPGILTCQGKFRDMLGKAPGHVARRHSVLGLCAWVRGVSGALAWVLGPCLGPWDLSLGP